ncbi:mammalian cell entry protein [Mycobacterium sp. M1]|uniref:Mammalian cell entry protein n=1 Tax=Mycolicibacter acidiphilus TaxID=2835306 RepID=A0ABS5RRX0_9MYCO|nr:mammalian cell entry protein [Mycolicibacter acidiphilus]MBS9535699.1 mammalian cell entry protein [Mycolicibacter acidiphilus]
MSPRRRMSPGQPPLFTETAVPAPGRWRFRLLVVHVVLAVSAALAICALALVSHVSVHRAAVNQANVRADVDRFMAHFTSPDPFHANDYVDEVLAHATGEFATMYREKVNMTLAHIVHAQPATGSVLDSGIERWNDDGSATLLVVTQVRSKSRDGKKDEDVPYRWIVTAEQEGSEWKISNLIQVL